MSTFPSFTALGAITDDTIGRFAAKVPETVASAWRVHGTGLVGDGFVRLVDPGHARAMLDGVVNLPDNAVPVFTTALADVIVCIESAFYVLNFRLGYIDLLDTDALRLLQNLSKDQFLDQSLVRAPYREAVERLGVPGLDECFGYVPLLALGGTPDPDHLDRGGLWEHIAVIVQLAGPLRPRA